MTMNFTPPDRVARIREALDLALRSRTGLLSRKEAAAYLGITAQTLAEWHRSKRYPIPVVKVGRLAKYRQADLDAFVNSQVDAQESLFPPR